MLSRLLSAAIQYSSAAKKRSAGGGSIWRSLAAQLMVAIKCGPCTCMRLHSPSLRLRDSSIGLALPARNLAGGDGTPRNACASAQETLQT